MYTEEPKIKTRCLNILIIASLLGSRLLGSSSASDTAGSALSVRGVEGEIDVLLGVNANQERRHVHGLLADANVSLSNKDTGVVDRFG
jgi:hypothetical protein